MFGCGEGRGRRWKRAEAQDPSCRKGQAAIFNPSLGWSGDLVSGRRDGEKGRMPEAHGHLILLVTFTAWPLGLGQL